MWSDLGVLHLAIGSDCGWGTHRWHFAGHATQGTIKLGSKVSGYGNDEFLRK